MYCFDHIGDEWGATRFALRAKQSLVKQEQEVVIRRRGQDQGVDCLIEAGEQTPGEREGGVLIVGMVANGYVEALHI